MASSDTANESTRGTVLDRLVGSIPSQYREEVTRFANGIRDRLPPIMVEHRIDALQRHLDARLDAIEAKLDRVLGQLGQNR